MIVLVTGGTRGIGKGIAARFRADGHDVVVCGRRPPQDCPFDFMAADVRDPDAVDSLNVANAGAAMMYEVHRQRGAFPGPCAIEPYAGCR